jgi:hypothetical protein
MISIQKNYIYLKNLDILILLNKLSYIKYIKEYTSKNLIILKNASITSIQV